MAQTDLTEFEAASIRPQDDFYRHVNGAFLDQATIPPDRGEIGVWSEANDRVQRDLEHILSNLGTGHAPGTPEQLVGDFYTSFLDLPRLASQGDELLRDLVREATEINNMADLSARFGLLIRHQLNCILQFQVVSDPTQPSRYIPRLSQGGLGLPNRDYYTKAHHADALHSYSDHIVHLLEMIDYPDPARTAEQALWLESEIARCHVDLAASRDVQTTLTPTPISAVAELTPELDWGELLFQLDLAAEADPQVILAQPDYLPRLAPLLQGDLLDQWRSWMAWRVVVGLADYGPAPLAQAQWEFTDTVLMGLEAPLPRNVRALGYVEHFLGEAMGRLYARKHFSEAAATKVEDLVANIVAEYRHTFEHLHWLTPITRTRAIDKLGWLGSRIGAPKYWHDYSTLYIAPDDLLGNALRAASHATETDVDKLFGLVSGEDWQIPPHVLNAYYDLSRNQIVLPAACLQPPFFDADADDAVNYGAIGAIIAHEIGHGFDDRGSHFDGEGRLREWWLPSDREHYQEIIAALKAQLADLDLSEAPGARLTPDQIVSEAISDLGGLAVAYRAWQRTRPKDDPAEVDGIPAIQRFFLSFARIWRSATRPEEFRFQLENDTHPPAEVRCNHTLRNFDPFQVAFAVLPTDGMWLRPGLRISLW